MSTIKIKSAVPKLRFEKSGYYFIGLLILVFLGFWKSYFSGFFTGKSGFSFFSHFHAVMMLLWVAMLIIQPILIRKKKLQLHRDIGKASYVLMPVLLISVLLILNRGLKEMPADAVTFLNFIFPVRDFFLLAVAFTIAMVYRRNVQIHARAMIITGIVFIEPALFRLLGGVIFKGMGSWGLIVGIFLMVSLITTLIIIERKQKTARWLFPALLAIDLLVYSLIIFDIEILALDPMMRWFADLPLT